MSTFNSFSFLSFLFYFFIVALVFIHLPYVYSSMIHSLVCVVILFTSIADYIGHIVSYGALEDKYDDGRKH